MSFGSHCTGHCIAALAGTQCAPTGRRRLPSRTKYSQSKCTLGNRSAVRPVWAAAGGSTRPNRECAGQARNTSIASRISIRRIVVSRVAFVPIVIVIPKQLFLNAGPSAAISIATLRAGLSGMPTMQHVLVNLHEPSTFLAVPRVGKTGSHIGGLDRLDILIHPLRVTRQCAGH